VHDPYFLDSVCMSRFTFRTVSQAPVVDSYMTRRTSAIPFDALSYSVTVVDESEGLRETDDGCV